MDEEKGPSWLDRLTLVAEGEFAGWYSFGGHDPFEALTGPFYFKKARGQPPEMAFRSETKHMNGAGFMHGGCLMTFADFCLFVIAAKALKDSMAVTATFNCELIGSVGEGARVEASGEVVKAGRSLIFVRGLLTSASEPVMTFSGVLKKIRRRE